MKLPNGYGTVAKLSGNRRKPYVVRKTIGWNEKKHPICQTIGYCATREEGLILLAEFNKSPWDIDHNRTTFEDLYKLWEEKKMPKLGKGNQNNLRAAYNHCKALFDMKYNTIKAYHMQECIDQCGRGYSTQSAIKNLFNHLDKYALEMDIITRAYSDLLTSESIPETSRTPFTEDEINRLWKIKTEPWVDSVLTFLYTGFRISELLDLKIENINLGAGTIQGGSKTDAGKNRIVPIHPRIEEFVSKRVLEGEEYLFSYNGDKCDINRYYRIWEVVMMSLDMNHKPHECRHTFRSRMDSAGANKRCIDLIMGHKSNDVGERVYTHKTIQELKDAIKLIM